MKSIVALSSLTLLLMYSSAHALVVYEDGFGDGDVNNDGVINEIDFDVSGNATGTAGDTYTPVEDSLNPGMSLIFPNTPATIVQELDPNTFVPDASDVGLEWYQARGFDGSGNDKPSVRIIDDSAGNLPETNLSIGFTSPHNGAQQFSAAIDSGPALAIEQKGRGSAFTAFFDSDYSDGNDGRVSLGTEVGDQVKVSLDFRVWMSAPNFNGSSATHVPRFGDIRFGLFQDTDSELGTSNPTAGSGGTPAVWGEEGGHFRGDNGIPNQQPSAFDDHGWLTRIYVGDPDTNLLGLVSPDGTAARVYEEENDIAGEKFLEGADLDSVIVPTQGVDTFVNLDYRKVYNLALTLERFDDPNTIETTGDTIRAILEVHDYATNTTYTLDDYEDVGLTTPSDPDGGFESDSWDYFGMKADGSSDEFDYLIDNFRVEIFGSNATEFDPADLNQDGFVDGLDLGILLGNWNTSTTPDMGELNGTPPVDGLDLGILLGAWNPAPAASVAAVPEPNSLLILVGMALLVSSKSPRAARN